MNKQPWITPIARVPASDQACDRSWSARILPARPLTVWTGCALAVVWLAGCTPDQSGIFLEDGQGLPAATSEATTGDSPAEGTFEAATRDATEDTLAEQIREPAGDEESDRAATGNASDDPGVWPEADEEYLEENRLLAILAGGEHQCEAPPGRFGGGPYLNSGHDAFWIARRLVGAAWVRVNGFYTATVAEDVGRYFEEVGDALLEEERESLFVLTVCRAVQTLGAVVRLPGEELLARRLFNEASEDELLAMRHYLHIASDYDLAWPDWREELDAQVEDRAISERLRLFSGRADHYLRGLFGTRQVVESDFDAAWRDHTRELLDRFIAPSSQRLVQALNELSDRYVLILENEILSVLRSSGFSIESIPDSWKEDLRARKVRQAT